MGLAQARPNKSKLEMEVDTGAALSVISKSTYDQLWSDESAPPLKPAAAKLKTYTGEQIRVVGAITVEVEHNHQQKRLGLLVVAGKGPSLLGRDWLSKITLSRLPIPESLTQITPPGETVLVMETLQTSPIKASQIKQWTDHDPVLAVVRDKLQQGWTHTDDEQMKPYQRRREELSIQDGCILWGNRVVIPPPGRAKVIEELHEGHPGATRMKALARSYVWWPQMDAELESKVKSCYQCQIHQHAPAVAPLHPWEWPQRPWSRVHVDYAGPFLGKMFLILIDAHSKWMEVEVVSSATSAITITKLRSIFATHGLPSMLVSDNGSVFTSDEIHEFTKENGIQHVRTTPYHPSSNGLAERAVQVFKSGMKKITSGTIEARLARFLFHYRITPHTTKGLSPAEMLMGRRPRSRLDLVHPDVGARVERKQQVQKRQHDKRAQVRHLEIDDKVFVRDSPGGKTWLPGSVVETRGPLLFIIDLEDGRRVRRRIDHVRLRTSESVVTPDTDDWVDDLITTPSSEPTNANGSDTVNNSNPPPNVQIRRSTRSRQAPDYLSRDM